MARLESSSTSNEPPLLKKDSCKYLAFGIEKDLDDSISDRDRLRQPRSDDDISAPVRVPKGGIAMAIFLTLAGAYLTIYGLLVVVGFCVPKHTDGMWFRVGLGILIFIPGVYHVRLALFAYLEFPGYSFADFPEF